MVSVLRKIMSLGIGFVMACGAMWAAASEGVKCSAPLGYEVIRAAGPPLVERPMFATYDDRGRLFVMDSGGVNGDDRGSKPPDVIRLLEDTDGDGVFDISRIFADQIVFGTGLLWYDGALYVTSPPSLWRIRDTDGDDVADERRVLATGFAFNQSCSDDLHGACLGPDGRIYFLPGRFPHRVQLPDGTVLREALGPWLMRCRPDGSEMEFFSGCVGNPVEVDFLPSGEMFAQGTYWAKPSMGGGLRDAVIHVVDGAEYSVRDRDYTDRIRTGDLLPSLVPMSATAPSGCMIYRGASLGKEFQGDLFGAYFNTGKILRHRLNRVGGTFVAHTEDFLTPVAEDVHFTDVLEDADGTVLAIDTGGWFRRCCPTSQIAKPEILGAIYRVRKAGAPRAKDARGWRLDWSDATPIELVQRLGDDRSAVREKAIEALRRCSTNSDKERTAVVNALQEALVTRSTVALHRNQIIWALCRMDGVEARRVLRQAMSDDDLQNRLAAISSVSLHRDREAAESLLRILIGDSDPAVRREAANALGRIGDRRAVPRLLESLAASPSQNPERAPEQKVDSGTVVSINTDPFLEHALVLALIRIGDSEQTRTGLTSAHPRIQRGALIALDQMSDGKLQSPDLLRVVDASDRDLRRAATSILLRHPEWTDVAARMVQVSLNGDAATLDANEEFIEVLRQFAGTDAVRTEVGKVLAAFASGSRNDWPKLSVLLDGLRQSEIPDVPDRWTVDLMTLSRVSAAKTDADVARAALLVIAAWKLGATAGELQSRVAAPDESPALRIAIASTLLQLNEGLPAGCLDFLRSRIESGVPLDERLAAWETIAAAQPSREELLALLSDVDQLTPLELPYLLRVAKTSKDDVVGQSLVETLERIDLPIHPDSLNEALTQYSDSIRQRAMGLIERQQQAVAAQAARIDEMVSALGTSRGDVEGGRALFFGKANCSACHQVEGQGAKIGPDLSGIGAVRQLRDLVEAVVVPSASFARGYEPVTLSLNDGRVFQGLMGRETAAEVTFIAVQEGKPVELRFHRDQIDDWDLGRVSVMPDGLERSLSPGELADLFRFLQSRTASTPTTSRRADP